MNLLEQTKEKKKNELHCLKKTLKEVSSVLQGEKQQFEKQNLSFSSTTIGQMIEPLQKEIDKTEFELKELNGVKEKGEQLMLMMLMKKDE